MLLGRIRIYVEYGLGFLIGSVLCLQLVTHVHKGPFLGGHGNPCGPAPFLRHPLIFLGTFGHYPVYNRSELLVERAGCGWAFFAYLLAQQLPGVGEESEHELSEDPIRAQFLIGNLIVLVLAVREVQEHLVQFGGHTFRISLGDPFPCVLHEETVYRREAVVEQCDVTDVVHSVGMHLRSSGEVPYQFLPDASGGEGHDL